MEKFSRLTLEERKQIQKLLDEGKKLIQVARELSRSPETISAEIRKNGGIRLYDAEKAQERSDSVRKESNKDKYSPMMHLDRRVTFLEEQMKLLMESNVLR